MVYILLKNAYIIIVKFKIKGNDKYERKKLRLKRKINHQMKMKKQKIKIII